MPNVLTELNPLFETFSLLVNTSDFSTCKKAIIDTLNELGLNGEELYHKELKIFDLYANTFIKYKKDSEEKDFFFNADDDNFILLLTYFLSSSEFNKKCIEKYGEEEIKNEMIFVAKELFGKKEKGNNDTVSFIDNLTLSASERWKFFMLLQKPKEYLLKLISIIDENKMAYNKAFEAVKDNYAKEIVNYEKYLMTKELKEALAKAKNINPSLAMPLSVIMYDDNCYCGIFANLVTKKEENDTLKFLKAISDKSRLEIIEKLKKKPMYNLEIAEEMNLTAATTSHHISILLSCDIIETVKKSGKVYYTINRSETKKLINDLEKKLLK